MRSSVLISTFLFLTVNSCVSPKQPPLSESESKFIDQLKNECNCDIIREIDVATINNNKKKGGYALTFILPCDQLLVLHNDSVAVNNQAKIIAKNVYNNLLVKPSQISEVSIAYVCDTSHAAYKTFLLVYPIEQLK